jgi:hypothetical protein
MFICRACGYRTTEVGRDTYDELCGKCNAMKSMLLRQAELHYASIPRDPNFPEMKTEDFQQYNYSKLPRLLTV